MAGNDEGAGDDGTGGDDGEGGDGREGETTTRQSELIWGEGNCNFFTLP
jgi:hypothetical protein